MKTKSKVWVASGIGLFFQILFILAFTPFFYRPAEAIVFFSTIGVAAAVSIYCRFKLRETRMLQRKKESMEIIASILGGAAIGSMCLFIGEFTFLVLYAVEIWFLLSLWKVMQNKF